MHTTLITSSGIYVWLEESRSLGCADLFGIILELISSPRGCSAISGVLTHMGDLMKDREAEISRILMKEPVDLKALRKISRLQGGFLSNQIRARVWPKLLGVNRFDISDYRGFIDPHRDDTQVRVDVERSLWRIDKTLNWRESYREDRRQALCDIIMAVLCRNSDIYYYQGFHDIVSVLLLVVEDDHIAFALTEVICRDFISDFMNCDFEVVGKAMRMLLVIIKSSDSTLHRFLVDANVEPYFATSWLLTWFSHDLALISDAARVYDAILCAHPLFCYYICAAYVIHLRSEILSSECEFSAIHNILIHSPREVGFPVEKIVAQADVLFARTPPDVLRKLCDSEVQKLIYYNQIAAMCKPHVFQDFAPSDWTLLKLHRVQQASANTFYLQHNYVDIMTYMGYSNAAYRVVDAAAIASSKSKRLKDNNGNEFTEKNNGNNLNNIALAVAVLLAGGVVSYSAMFGR